MAKDCSFDVVSEVNMQEVIQMLKQQDLPVELQFVNFRS